MYVLILLILFVLQHNGITLDTTICTGELNFLKDCPNVVVLPRLQRKAFNFCSLTNTFTHTVQ